MGRFIQLVLLACVAFFVYDYFFDGRPGLFNTFNESKILEKSGRPPVVQSLKNRQQQQLEQRQEQQQQ